VIRRLVLPFVLVAAAIGCGVGAYLADQGGDTAEVSEVSTGPVTPVLSARRIPDFLTEDIADRRLTQSLSALAATAPPDSCLVVDAGGRPIVADRADRPLIPASNEKLTLAAAALAELGPTHRFATTVVGTRPNGQGVVSGDVYLVGGGDPVLATQDYAASSPKQAEAHTSLEDLAARLEEAGVTEIRGRILGDESRFDSARFVDAWPPRFVDQNQTGPLSALSVNDGYSAYPTAANPGVTLTRAGDPPLVAAQQLLRLLDRRGIRVTGTAGTGRAPGGATEIARIRSAPLRDLVAQLLTWSDNQTAELLLKELGFARDGTGTTTAGSDVVEDVLQAEGYEVAGFDAVDGSGLAGGNRTTCALLHEVLAEAGPRSPVVTGLAVAGETGTLAATFNGTPAEGRLRAKTGTLNESTALSGVVDVPDGDDLTFALVINEDFVSQTSLDLRIRIGLAMAAYPERPSLDRVGPRPLPR
jgi:D-alanyl-D-alanine carboxypeptidase/D-alanyl-D-alanine-endopeptidase (penicillin-binding protein 4)